MAENAENIFGGIVESAGFGCPLETPEIEGAADTDLADMRALVERMAEGGKSLTFAELVGLVQEAGLFTRLIPDEGEPDRPVRVAFSAALLRYDRCMIGDCRFTISGKGHRRRYQAERIMPHVEAGGDLFQE